MEEPTKKSDDVLIEKLVLEYEAAEPISGKRIKILEERFEIHIRKPKWCPQFLFKFIIKNFIVLEIYK